MKQIMGMIGVLVACVACAQERWTYEKPYVWARDAKEVTLATEGSAFKVTHTGKQDWSLAGLPRIPVKPGDIFEIACKVKMTSSGGWANADAGVVLRDEKNKELSWSYGGASASAPCDWTELRSRFIVPKGAASIEPRVIGVGAVTIWVDGYAIARAGAVQDRVNPAMPKHLTLAGAGVSVDVDCATGRFAVTDARTGRVWSQSAVNSDWMVLDAVPTGDKRGVTLTLLNPETTREIRATLAAAKDVPELSVEIASEGTLTKPLDFPSPFETRKGDRLIVPMNEGMSYPVEEEHQGLYRMIAYGGHGICMGFFGVAEDATGAGWMCILETSDDAAMNAHRASDGLWQAGPSWDASMGKFSYTRKARYVFFDKGGHVAMCKRYREHAKQVGLYKPFTEKVKRNPKIDLLIGAANIWSFSAGKDKVKLVAEMQAAGMGRILWSGAGSAEELTAMNAMTNVLTGRYDIYQDIMDPANFDKIRYHHGDWVTEAFPQNINWAGPNGLLRRGWEIEKKDGSGMIPCAVICDAKALPYARKRISEELKTKPYGARFIDTTVAAPWFECYHPDHMMTRSQSRQHKMELLNVISGEFNLVCGSETGHEASVPFCDYFEGMLSIGNYRVEDAGRHMDRVLDEVPERVAKYQVGEAYRLPLWELVYHDCVVAQWYWGDYNNKLPKIWRKRDLFNALYGTPPMYMLTMKQWADLKDKFAASYKVAEPVSRATGYSEMTDHRILTPDRHVQQSVFANGVTVTVNFGAAPYTAANGKVIPPMDMLISGI